MQEGEVIVMLVCCANGVVSAELTGSPLWRRLMSMTDGGRDLDRVPEFFASLPRSVKCITFIFSDHTWMRFTPDKVVDGNMWLWRGRPRWPLGPPADGSKTKKFETPG